MVLNERAGVFPVTETDSEIKRQDSQRCTQSEDFLPVVIWTPSEVKHDSEDDEADDGQDLDGAGDDRRRSVNRRNRFKLYIHAREDKLGFSVCTY